MAGRGPGRLTSAAPAPSTELQAGHHILPGSYVNARMHAVHIRVQQQVVRTSSAGHSHRAHSSRSQNAHAIVVDCDLRAPLTCVRR